MHMWETHGTVLAAVITAIVVVVLAAAIVGLAWMRRGTDPAHPLPAAYGHRALHPFTRSGPVDLARDGNPDNGPSIVDGDSTVECAPSDVVHTGEPPDPPVVYSTLRPETAVPPRFEDGSAAARLPWLLPEEHTAPSGIAADQAVLGTLTVRAASVVGVGHRCERPAKPRQDAYRIAQDQTAEHLIVAVADGMSDSPRAEFGAMVAVATAVGLVRHRLDRGERIADLRPRGLFTDVAAGILAAAEDRGLRAADVRTTLTVAVIPTGPADSSRTAWVGHVADTTVWIRTAEMWQCVTSNVKGSFDGIAVRRFMPHHPDAALSQTFTVDAGATLAVLSDGVADSFQEIRGANAWLADRWRDPPPLASFLLDVDFEARAQHDDRTAVVVWFDRERPGR
jgi:hypothetical protein